MLSALDWVDEVKADEGALMVAATLERSSELTAALAQVGIYVREMSSIKLSLEEYFLDVTGDDKDAEVEEA